MHFISAATAFITDATGYTYFFLYKHCLRKISVQNFRVVMGLNVDGRAPTTVAANGLAQCLQYIKQVKQIKWITTSLTPILLVR